MKENKNNIFIRVLMIGLVGFIIWIITYSFLHIEPKGSISTGMITLIIFLIIIVLSESFDNFSVAKLFTMTRELKTKDISIEKLDNQNNELRREIIKVVTSISQNQSSTNIIGFPDEIAKRIGVQKATQDEITKKRSEESEDTPDSTQVIRKRINHQKLEEIVFKKFLNQSNLSEYNLIKEAKLVTQFSGIDAISNIQPIYDGYINTGESEIFIEIKALRGLGIIMREQIYLMLNKIYLYNEIKNANAHLNLRLIPLNVDGDMKLRKRHADLLKEYFEPAIVKGLLKIIELELSEEEIEEALVE